VVPPRSEESPPEGGEAVRCAWCGRAPTDEAPVFVGGAAAGPGLCAACLAACWARLAAERPAAAAAALAAAGLPPPAPAPAPAAGWAVAATEVGVALDLGPPDAPAAVRLTPGQARALAGPLLRGQGHVRLRTAAGQLVEAAAGQTAAGAAFVAVASAPAGGQPRWLVAEPAAAAALGRALLARAGDGDGDGDGDGGAGAGGAAAP
jgi:hypothetical protein